MTNWDNLCDAIRYGDSSYGISKELVKNDNILFDDNNPRTYLIDHAIESNDVTMLNMFIEHYEDNKLSKIEEDSKEYKILSQNLRDSIKHGIESTDISIHMKEYLGIPVTPRKKLFKYIE